MDYNVSENELLEKYSTWKDALLLELYHSLDLHYDMNNPLDYQIDSILKYNLLLSGLTGLLHTRFRGEARYHKNPCLPIITRKDIQLKTEDYELNEISRFKESPRGIELGNKLDKNDITWWMLTQHYSGFDTRLLDITRNPLVALYFACEKHPDKDGYVYVFHSMDKTSMPLNEEYSTYEDHIKDEDEYYKKDQFIYMRPSVSMDRISRQEGEFLWIKNFSKLISEGFFETKQIIPILIKKEYKAKLLEELNDPQGINQEFLNIGFKNYNIY